MEFQETNGTYWNKGQTPRFFCTCFLFLYRHCSIQTVVLIRIHVLWLLALKSILLPKSSSPALWSSALLAANLAPVSHAGVGPAMWMAAWMLISRCNKVFEVCNTLLQNHNVKIPLWIGRLALLDTPGSPHPTPNPSLQPIFLIVLLLLSPNRPFSPSPPTSFNNHFWQEDLPCSDRS